MKHLLTFITVSLYTLVAMAESFPYRQMFTIDTPKSEELHCLYMDNMGLIWIGTDMGLKSYDGYMTIAFRSGVNSPNLFPSNDIRCITEDAKGNLWLGTRNGLVCFSPQWGKTRCYPELGIVYTLFTSKDGTVWIGTDEGLSRYMPEEDRIYTYNSQNSRTVMPDGKHTKTPYYGVKSIIEDQRGNLFIGTWSHSLLRMDVKTSTFYRYPSFNSHASAYSLYLDSRGKLWIGTWGYGLLRLNKPYNQQDPQPQQISYAGTTFNTFYNIIEDPVSKNIMACTREGIIIINPGTDIPELKAYTRIGDRQLIFANDIMTDKEGNVWVGTASNGILQFNTHPSVFPQFQLDKTAFSPFIYCVNSIYTPDGRYVWMGIKPFGIARHDLLTGETRINTEIEGMESIPEATLGAGFNDFEKRSNGELWMANWTGIVVRKPDGETTRWDNTNTDFLNENLCTKLYQAKNGLMWVGQRSGISIVYPNNKGYLLKPQENGQRLKSAYVMGISEDKRGNIWLATNNRGIIRVSNTGKGPANMQYKQYAPEKKNLIVYDMTNVLEDRQGRLWAISNSGGLFLYNKKEDRFEPKNQEYRIEGDRIFSIAEDPQGNLWMTSDQRLIRLTVTDGEMPLIISYGKEDGLEGISFAPNAVTQYGDKLYFNSQNGYFTVNTKLMAGLQRKKSYNLMVTNIYIDNEPIANLDSITRAKITELQPIYTQQLTIPHGIKKVEIEFALLTHGHTDNIRYAYKLDGYQDGWQYTPTGQRTAIFQNLPAGVYELQLKASDGYGNWTAMPYTMTLKVLPPWWATWWAYIVYILLLIAGVKLAIEWYKKHLKTKNRLQMQVIFTNITHELLTPLTVILNSVEELRDKNPHNEGIYQLMQNNINHITRMLREILEVRKSQAGQLRLLVTRGDLAAFLRTACENLRPMSHHRNAAFHVHIPEKKVMGWFDSDKLEKIVYNLLSNAFKYNKENGYTHFMLEVAKDKAIIRVEDTGIGISPKKMKHLYTRFFDGDYRQENTSGTGIGLSLTHDLVKLHHGTIDCKSQEGSGTTFTITIPLKKSAYKPDEINEHREHKGLNRQQMAVIQEEMEQEAEEDKNQNADNYRILIVEDNEQLLRFMKKMLSKKYKVLTAKDGLQAWNIIQKEQLDIVVSDVMMPVMDGIELTARIKQDPNFNLLPVILLTAMVQEEDRDNAFEQGADEYLIKPFKMSSLQKRIDNIIERRNRLKEHFAAQINFKAEEQNYASPDETFMKNALAYINLHLSEPEYGREELAADMCMSSSSLYNKVRALTGQTIVGFITSIRLKKAYQILEQNPKTSVTKLAEKMGFNTPSYFSKCFKKEYGFLPSEMRKNKGSK